MLVVLLVLGLYTDKARALVLTSYFETVLVKDVSTSWTTVALDNSYSNAIPVCTYVLGTFAGSPGNYVDPPAVPRIRNIGASSFELRVQGWEDSAASTNDVHCIVMEEGAHTLPDGRLVEAHSVLSDQTNGQFSTDGGWNLALMENVSASIVHSYSNPTVLGQVMSYNDNRASSIFVTNCASRTAEPFSGTNTSGICVGKQIGQVVGNRNPETVGYIVAESGSGTVNNVFYELALGADSIAGNTSGNLGDTYGLANHHTTAVLTLAGMDGGNGGWATLYGDPLTPGAMQLAVDEEVFASDTSRNHTNEQVYYWAFAGAEITLVKNVINDDDGTSTVDDFKLVATGDTDTVSGVSGTTDVTKVIVQPGNYLLAENSVPGYTASAWSCVGDSGISGNEVRLSAGDHAVCTIVNDDDSASTLTLVKELTNDAGGTAVASDFTLKFASNSGGPESGSGVTGDAAITSVVVSPGSYALGESTLPGYVLSGIRCDGADLDGSDGVDIKPGENITCYFLNDDQGVDLSIVKSVNNTTPNIGEVLTFTLLITNSGPDSATDLNVIDPLPVGFSYYAASISGGDIRDDSSPAGTGLDWTINSLAAGASTSLTFEATVLSP